MRIPESLGSLVDHGILEDVVRPLMSGKEAQVYLVISGGEERVAKVYKEAQNRTFKHRAAYTEGRKVRNSRDQRAIEKRSRHGRAQDEAAWRSAEVDMIYRLKDAGVRVPKPYHFIDGVLIMELVKDHNGQPAPRLGDLQFTPEEALQIFQQLLGEVVRMLCAGVVHGDLSDFNVLMGETGPVVIDFPQAVNASGNQNARRILTRDVANLQRFVERFAPGAPKLPYAEEMWHLYERNALSPETKLTGRFRSAARQVSEEAVLSLVKDAEYDERRRREGLGLAMRGMGDQTAQRRRGPSSPQEGQRAGEARPLRAPLSNAQRPGQGPLVEQRPHARRESSAGTPTPRREQPNASPPARREAPANAPPHREQTAASTVARREQPNASPPRRREAPANAPPHREQTAASPSPRREQPNASPPRRREAPENAPPRREQAPARHASGREQQPGSPTPRREPAAQARPPGPQVGGEPGAEAGAGQLTKRRRRRRRRRKTPAETGPV